MKTPWESDEDLWPPCPAEPTWWERHEDDLFLVGMLLGVALVAIEIVDLVMPL